MIRTKYRFGEENKKTFLLSSGMLLGEFQN
jgi:hypothetical protein